jgi:hypothetical protein
MDARSMTIVLHHNCKKQSYYSNNDGPKNGWTKVPNGVFTLGWKIFAFKIA